MNPLELLEWIDGRPMAKMERAIIEMIFMTVIWVFWSYGNLAIYRPLEYKKHFIFDNIVAFSFR